MSKTVETHRSPNARAARPRRTRLTLRKRLAFAALATAGFFVTLELGLRLLGVQPVTLSRDPWVGFDSRTPLFVELPADQGGDAGRMATAPLKQVWFNPQSFPRRKPPGLRRVFCLGGSTTYGRPYGDATSYCGWLRELLPEADGSTQWEVINAGGVSYASYRVAALMEELTRYEPDLFIVYSAHNEFLERRTYAAMLDRAPALLRAQSLLAETRTWALLERLLQPAAASGDGNRDPSDNAGDNAGGGGSATREVLPGEVDERLNHTVGPSDYHRDAAWRAGVLRHYELNLERMVVLSRRAGAGIVFIMPASNEMDCSPFKSELSDALSQGQRQEFWRLFSAADVQQQAGDFEQALETFQRAAVIDQRHPMLQYRIGRLQSQLGRQPAARKSFVKALNEDICPLRAVEEISAALRRVARRSRVPLVEFEELLRAQSRAELGLDALGDHYFLDHVHPTLAVHRQLALWTIDALRRHDLLGGAPPSLAAIAQAQQRIDSRVDEHAQGVALRNLAKVLHWSGKFSEAAPRARDALARIPDDPESLFVLADCLLRLGRPTEAQRLFERVLEVDAGFSRAYIPLGGLLAAEGDLQGAKLQLATGLLFHPQDAFGHYTLGVVHLQLGEFRLARESLEESDRWRPEDPGTLYYWARAELETDAVDSAIQHFEKSLRLFDEADTHFWLGEALQRQSQLEAARIEWEAALRLNTEHAAAKRRLSKE